LPAASRWPACTERVPWGISSPVVVQLHRPETTVAVQTGLLSM
jgi:hypothetical protein